MKINECKYVLTYIFYVFVFQHYIEKNQRYILYSFLKIVFKK